MSRNFERLDRERALLALALARANGAVAPQVQNPSWLQPQWYVDPRNRTGRAKDTNDGRTPMTPVLTWNGGVIARYGTLAPILPQDTGWFFLSGTAAAESDPIVFSPVATAGAVLTLQGQLGAAQKIGSGILAGVVPRNYAAGTLLTATLGSAGPVAVNMFVVNTTAGKASAAWTYGNPAGSTFTLSQPVTRTTVPLTIPLFVDTWADGDSFDVYAPDAIELAQFAPTFSDSAGRAYVQQLAFESSQAGSSFYWGNGVALQECRSDRRTATLQGGLSRSSYSTNTIYTDPFGVNGGSRSNGRALLIVGVPSQRFLAGFGSLSVEGVIVDANFIIAPTGGSSASVAGCVLGTVHLATSVLVEGVTVLGLFDADGPRIWGPGQFGIEDGRTVLAGGSAVATFLNTAVPPILLGGLSVGFTATRANPSVVNGSVPITLATIDANADPAGVGMFVPGGGSISNLL